MKGEYILALDQGTTSSRAVIFDRQLRPLGVAGREFKQHYPRPGWVEHEPDDLFGSIFESASEVMRKLAIRPEQLLSIGIANQRETTLVWERRTGRPVYPAIVWQCRRTADICREISEAGMAGMIKEKTGLLSDPYFSATKIKWILDQVNGVRAAAEKGDLCFGTVDSYLVWKLTEGKFHLTDYTNAARTMLFNIHRLDWDEELLKLFNIPRSMLPEVVPSRGVPAVCNHPLFDRLPIPISGVAGDQQAALFGQFCDNPGAMKITYGTGAFLLLNIGGEPIQSRHGLITTLGAGSRPGKPEYALEGSVFMAGAIMQWLRDGIGILPDVGKAGEIAAALPDNGGVYMVPAFTGLGAPYWDAGARAAILGMTRGTGRNEIIRAAEEAIAYQCADLIEAMRKDVDLPIPLVKVDGGAARDNFLLQFQADILNCVIEKPSYLESTVLGAARLARGECGKLDHEGVIFAPKMKPELREKLLLGWRKAVSLCRTT